jgi:phosphatidyl-myo-inositol dimannoside synthase
MYEGRGRTMKVLLLAWDFPPGRGGIQTWMLELARRLPDAQVRVLAPAVPGDHSFDAASGCQVARLGNARFGRIPWMLQLCARTLRECLFWRPDVIVCGHVMTAPAALLARRLLSIPYVAFTYGQEIRRRRWKRLLSFLLPRARLVVACSRFTRSAVLELAVPAERVRILYPGVDPQRFSPGSDEASHTRPRTLLTVARLADLWKGHDTAIRALPLIQTKCPDVRYMVAGDGRLRDYLQRVARSFGVERDVVFLGDVSDQALGDLYRSCDVFLLLSRPSASDGDAEGFGIVCLEAGACAKPVVAGRSGGILDAVRDQLTGILVDPEDVGGVAEAVISVLRDPLLAKRLGEAAREMVLARFTWDHVVGEARNVFAEAAGLQ